MGRPRVEHLLNNPVPHAKGVIYRDLCRVRRSYGQRLRPGQLLAKQGAWDRKAVVTHVIYLGATQHEQAPSPHMPRGYVAYLEAYAVGVLPLGRVYATYNMTPPARGEQPYEIYVETGGFISPGHHLRGWVPVEPVVEPTVWRPKVPMLVEDSSEVNSFALLKQSGEVPISPEDPGVTQHPVLAMMAEAQALLRASG